MRSFTRVLGLVFPIAVVTTCLSFAVSADADLIETGGDDDYTYYLYSDGLLEVESETETVDLEKISKSSLEKATSLSVDFSGCDDEYYTVSCYKDYCNISTFEFMWSDDQDVGGFAIKGFPKFTGAEGSIILPEKRAFSYLTIEDSNITSLDFLTGLDIWSLDFFDCDQLENVTVSGSYSSCYVSDCDKLTKVDLRGCTGMATCHVTKNAELTELYYPESLLVVPTYGCCLNPKLTVVQIPGSVLEIQDGAFQSSGLKSVIIPEGVVRIGYYSFAGNPLETIDIPATVNRIDAKSFLGCSSLKKVNFYGTQAQFEKIDISSYSGDSVSIYDVFGNATINFDESTRSVWVKGGDKWFYFDEAGVMAKGWKSVKGSWYLFSISYGIMLQDWQKSDNAWYYLGKDGAMKTGWQLIEDDWHYFGSDGAMRLGWQSIGGKWYYLDSANGSMKTGWQQIGGVWYYFESSGAMFTGWKQSGSDWYFLKSDGSMAANEYCQGYWLGSNGKWTYQYKATWRKDSKGWWYGDSTGWYAKNESVKIDGKVYNFDANGYCTNP